MRKNGIDAQLQQVSDPQALARALVDKAWQTWDAVLSDFNVPGMDFVTSLGQIRSAAPDLPVILVSGTIGEERAIALFKLGVTDFVLKDNLARLGPAILRALHDADALREKRLAEEALALAIEATGLGMFDHDPQNGVMTWNAEMKRIFGVPQDADIDFDGVMQRIDPRDRDAVANALKRATVDRSGGRFDIEHRVLALHNGRERWLRVSGRYFFDAEGCPVRCVGTALDVSEHKRSEERIRQTALHDPLTGLPNRGWLFESAPHLFGRARRASRCAGVLFLDLDRFKPVNDHHGHEVGDRILQEIARRLQACVREEDLVVRLGGDEFLVLLPEIGQPSAAEEVARHMLQQVRQPYRVGGMLLTLSLSVGISIFPRDGADLDTLVNHADMAMYYAKQNGRDNVQFYSWELAARSRWQARVEQQLQSALVQQAFSLHYQPVIDLQTAQVVGAEALVRWPEEAIGPDQFVPVAEASGQISQLGAWVIQEACRQRHSWHAHRLPPFPIAVNVSAVQLRHHDFVDQFSQWLADAGVEPSDLQIEVTETALMEQLDHATEVLARLSGLGVTIALDDFGTGYSSLNYLSRLPIHKIKVDKSFVQRLPQDSASRAIAEAVIALGKALKLEVVAEGIESEPVLRHLRSIGCTQAQGFYVCQPLPAARFEDWYEAYHISRVS